MTKLIICRGLQGSGKTTWAKEYCKQHDFVRVNRDDIRIEMGIENWNRKIEKEVIAERDRLIFDHLISGIDCISDDTNLSEKTFNHLKQLAQKCNVEVEVMDFRNVPLEDCIQRDKNRKNKVGKDVILEMYYKYIHKPVTPIWNGDLDSCIICDLDGTLAIVPEGRNHFDRDFENDIISYPVVDVIKSMGSIGYKLVFISGRMEKYREQTVEFLNKCDISHIYGYQLFMRRTDDTRADYIIKREIYEREIKDKFNVRFVIDDRLSVIRNCWIPLGLFVFNVNQYNLEF